MGMVVGLDYRDATLLGARRSPGAQGPPAGREDHRGRQAGRLGRQDDPVGRLLGACRDGYWAPGMVHRGRRRRDGQHPDAQGRALRDARGDVRRRGDLRAPQGRRGRRRPLELRGQGPAARRSRPTSAARATCASPSPGASSRRGDRQHDGDLRRPLPRRALEATHDDATVDVFSARRALPEARRQDDFDKLSSVFASGNATRDDAPNHIRIQDKVPLELALMWQNMCPAQVYEVPEEELEARPRGRQREARRQA